MTISDISKVAKGQKIIIYCLLVILASIGLGIAMSAAEIKGSGVLIFVIPISQLVALYGVLLAARGLGAGVTTLVLLALLMLVPVVGLLLLLIMNSRANRALKENGYEVGFLGAKSSQ